MPLWDIQDGEDCMRITAESLEQLERSLYSEEEWAELQELRKTNPLAIIRVPCIYKRLGVPDPAASCRECYPTPVSQWELDYSQEWNDGDGF